MNRFSLSTIYQYRKNALLHIQPILPAKIAFFIIFAASAALSACSASRTTTIDLIGRDFRFSPDLIKVTEGDTVKINFSNPDVVPHLIELPAFEQHIALPPGGYFTLEFVADKLGSFEFVCSVPGHQEAGMVGTLIVSPAP